MSRFLLLRASSPARSSLFRPGRHRSPALRAAVLAAVFGAGLAGAASADVDPPSDFRRSIEVAIGPLHRGTLLEGEERSLSLRGIWRFDNPWGIEISVSEYDEDRSYFRSGATSFEASVRRSLLRNRHVDFFLFAGGGYADGHIEFATFLDDEGLVVSRIDEDAWTAHFGLGVEVALGERWYVRTDLRERYLGDLDHIDSLDREITLGLGWRF